MSRFPAATTSTVASLVVMTGANSVMATTPSSGPNADTCGRCRGAAVVEEFPIRCTGSFQIGAEQVLGPSHVRQVVDPRDPSPFGDAERDVERAAVTGSDAGRGVPEAARYVHDVAGLHGSGPDDVGGRLDVPLGVAVHQMRPRGAADLPRFPSGELDADDVVVVPVELEPGGVADGQVHVGRDQFAGPPAQRSAGGLDGPVEDVDAVQDEGSAAVQDRADAGLGRTCAVAGCSGDGA